VFSFGSQSAGKVGADKAECAGDKDVHNGRVVFKSENHYIIWFCSKRGTHCKCAPAGTTGYVGCTVVCGGDD
jgi:hypothetical protein